MGSAPPAVSGYPDITVSVEQPLPAGDRRRLGAAGGVELAEDVGDVHRDGLRADEQLLADLAVGAALGDQREDLALAGGEGGRARAVGTRRGAALGLEPRERRLGAQPVRDLAGLVAELPSAG